MTTMWADVGARARGLSTRLMGGAVLRDLASASDLTALAHALERAAPGYALDDPPTPLGVDFAATIATGARLAILARWSGKRARLLAPVFDAEDHRAIRAALRGAVASSAPEERRAGLIPTEELPVRALDELARQPTTAAVASLLDAWEHPFARAILIEARREQPDLYALERALDDAFVERAERTALRGDAALKDFVLIAVTTARAWTALLSPNPDHELKALRARLPQSPLKTVLASAVPNTESIDRAALQTHLRLQHRHGLRAPLGLGPVLYFVARSRSELRDLRRIAWGIALGAPRVLLAGGVISP